MRRAAAKGSAAGVLRLYVVDGGQIDQVARLNEFRTTHPEVEIKKADGHWWAYWDSPTGRAHAYATELEWLLDMLDIHFPKVTA